MSLEMQTTNQEVIQDFSGLVNSNDVEPTEMISELTKKIEPMTWEEGENGREKWGIYTRDSENVYIGDNKIEGADPANFSVLNNHYGVDKINNTVYIGSQKIEGADAESFEPISVWFSKDAENAYFYNTTLTIEDLETFKVHPEIIGNDEKKPGEIAFADGKMFFSGRKDTTRRIEVKDFEVKDDGSGWVNNRIEYDDMGFEIEMPKK